MNRFLISILLNNELFDCYISAEDERTEEQFKEQAKRTYPPELGYVVVILNRPSTQKESLSVERKQIELRR
jgi:hypothetical protein